MSSRYDQTRKGVALMSFFRVSEVSFVPDGRLNRPRTFKMLVNSHTPQALLDRR